MLIALTELGVHIVHVVQVARVVKNSCRSSRSMLSTDSKVLIISSVHSFRSYNCLVAGSLLHHQHELNRKNLRNIQSM